MERERAFAKEIASLENVFNFLDEFFRLETIDNRDSLAIQLVNEAAGHLGVAVAGMINLLNPKRVILGGGLSRLGELLLEPLTEATRARSLVSSLAVAQLCTSELGPQSIAVGAATIVLDAALSNVRLFPTPLAAAVAEHS